LFGEASRPTDTIIRVRNHVFKVLGVMARKGRVHRRPNQNDRAFAPYDRHEEALRAAEPEPHLRRRARRMP
jgi:hypothetical protein